VTPFTQAELEHLLDRPVRRVLECLAAAVPGFQPSAEAQVRSSMRVTGTAA